MIEEKLNEFVRYYNYERYHESLENVTPAEVYYGKAQRKLKQRK
ncbi:IS3 family transposase [Bizionia arctica]|nr:IS3 family transposase [Bizionia arctica]